jgi:hypothetical protein
MIRKGLLGLVVVMFAISCGTMAFAEEAADKPTCNLDMTFYSQYIWRGYELSKDSLVIFPSVTVGYKGFEMNVWGDFDTDYKGAKTGNNDTEWWETDWIFSYTNAVGPVNWTVGWIYYDVDEADDEEVFVKLGLDCILSPEVSVWRGIEWGESWYYNLALSHSFPLNNGWSIDVGASAAYYDIEADDYSAWHDGTVWAGLNIPVNDWCTVTPSINYTTALSDDAKDVIKASSESGDDDDFIYGGVNVNISF